MHTLKKTVEVKVNLTITKVIATLMGPSPEVETEEVDYYITLQVFADGDDGKKYCGGPAHGISLDSLVWGEFK